MSDQKLRTRQHIIELLKTEGSKDASTLASIFGLTGMAIRQHLYALQEEGMVDFNEVSRPVGRPAKLWHLTKAADRYFPDSHSELTVGLINTMKKALGEDGFETVLRTRAKEQIAQYRRELGDVKSVSGKAKKLAAIRTREGYMAKVDQDEDGNLLLVENHCPICVAAESCTRLCRMELDVFQNVMGSEIRVERVDHILAGARRCAYKLEKV